MHKKVLPISVLIPTMNRPRALKRTIDKYISGESIPSQIVVVDQSEKADDAKEIQNILEEIKTIDVVYCHQEMPSLTVARNKAFGLATEEVIVCSDDDVDVFSDTIEKIDTIMRDSSIAMIAGLDDNMKFGKSKVGYLMGTKAFRYRHQGHVTMSMLGRFPESFDNQTPTMWAMGFFFVIRKSLVQKWNLRWDEKLKGYAYAEDLDFSFGYYNHARKEQYECILTKEIHVKHLASQEYRIPSRKSTFMYVLHRHYLAKKHRMGFSSEVAIRWCNFWILLSRKGQSKKDMLDAMMYYRKYKKQTQKGIFFYGV